MAKHADPASGPPPPLHVITFVTAQGRCCVYATHGTYAADGSVAFPTLPEEIQVQLDALGARVAWWCVEPIGICVRGDAADQCPDAPRPEALNHLYFVDRPSRAGPPPSASSRSLDV